MKINPGTMVYRFLTIGDRSLIKDRSLIGSNLENILGLDVIGHTKFKGNIQELLKEQITVLTILPCNNPVWLVKKPDGSYRLTVDNRKLNKYSLKIEGALSDIGFIINITTRSATYYILIDIPDMFIAVPIDKESQPMPALIWEGRQYQFTDCIHQ